MQEQRENGDYGQPEELNIEKLKKSLHDGSIRRILTFQSHDENGKPTQELRRAWRRHNKKG